MEKIGVVVVTYNDSSFIEECIRQAKAVSSYIVVVDLESTDDTVKKAKKLDAHVLTYPHSSYVEPVRDFSIQKADAQWLLIIDPDERVTPGLAKEIKEVLGHAGPAHSDEERRHEDARLSGGAYREFTMRWEGTRPVEQTRVEHKQALAYTHFRIPRKNLFGGKHWLRHGGWWPDYQIRLIHKPHFKSWPSQIHSTPVVSGSLGTLQEPLIHLAHGDFEKMVQKTIIFEGIESDLLFKAGKKASTVTFFRKFMGELGRRLILQRGFMDGSVGIIESIYQAYSKTITYLLLYEKNLKKKQKSRPL